MVMMIMVKCQDRDMYIVMMVFPGMKSQNYLHPMARAVIFWAIVHQYLTT